METEKLKGVDIPKREIIIEWKKGESVARSALFPSQSVYCGMQAERGAITSWEEGGGLGDQTFCRGEESSVASWGRVIKGRVVALGKGWSKIFQKNSLGKRNKKLLRKRGRKR